LIANRIAAERNDDWNCRRGSFRGPYGGAQGNNDIDLLRDQFFGQRRKPIKVTVRPPIGRCNCVPLDMTKLTQGAAELFYQPIVGGGIVEDANIRNFLATRYPTAK
jgi:hypothetical protein